MKHEKFSYQSLEEIKAKAEELQIHLPFASDTRVLLQEASFGNVTLKNRMGIAPMEGADALPDGSPSELTLRRYVTVSYTHLDVYKRQALSWPFRMVSSAPKREACRQTSEICLVLEGRKQSSFRSSVCTCFMCSR